MTLWRTAGDISQHLRFQRAQLRADCKHGASLATLLTDAHPAIEGVRCYQLLAWLPRVGETTVAHLLRGLPGHLRLARLDAHDRSVLLMRVRAHERRRANRHARGRVSA